jgi:membrane protease YdiL (CAAX protease family)
MLIFAPTSEELIYRGPIIILSGYLPEYKWLLIIISAIVFGIMHWYGAKISLHEIQQNEPSDGYETDNLKEISKTISDQKNKKTYILKSAQVVSATIGGVLMGYYGIKYQTIWVSVLIHFSWNLFLLVLANLLQVVLLAYILVMRWVEYIRSQLSKKMGGSY